MPGLLWLVANAPIVGGVLLVVVGLIVLAILRTFDNAKGVRLFRWRWIGLTMERGDPSEDERKQLEEPDDDPSG